MAPDERTLRERRTWPQSSSRRRGIRRAAFAAALVAYAYIVSVALTRPPAGFLRPLL